MEEEETRGSVGTAVLGAGPAGLTAAYVLARRAARGGRVRGRRQRRRDREDRRVRGLPLRPRRPSLLHEAEAGRAALGGAARRRIPRPPAAVADLLQGRVLRLSAARRRTSSRRLGVVERCAAPLSYLWGARATGERARDVRGLGDAASAAASTTRSSARTRRRSGASPAARSAPSGPRSGSRTSRSARRCSRSLGLRREQVTTLIEEFHYPRLGPGQMWEAFQARVEERGIPVHLNAPRASRPARGRRARDVVTSRRDARGRSPSTAVLSSIPLSELVLSLDPAAARGARGGRRALRYRTLVSSPSSRRSARRSPTTGSTSTTPAPARGASRTSAPGARMVSRARPASASSTSASRATRSGRCRRTRRSSWRPRSSPASGWSTRRRSSTAQGPRPEGLPDVRRGLPGAVDVLAGYLAGFDNLKTFGRNGLHRYNNQDHSMWTAILATLNLVDGDAHDVWSVNTEDDVPRGGGRGRWTTGGSRPRLLTHCTSALRDVLPVPRESGCRAG